MTTQDKIIKIISFIIITNIIVIVGYLFLAGYPKNVWELIRYNTILTLLATGLFYLINHFLWHLPLINKLFGSIPNLNGEWSGVIINISDNKEQEANMKITQTWLNCHIVTKAERGNSSSISAEIVKINETWKLYFIWSSSNDGTVFDGTTIVTIFEDELNGYYFSSSNVDKKGCTSGSFIFKKIMKIKD